jgi:hypothetical protein
MATHSARCSECTMQWPHLMSRVAHRPFPDSRARSMSERSAGFSSRRGLLPSGTLCALAAQAEARESGALVVDERHEPVMAQARAPHPAVSGMDHSNAHLTGSLFAATQRAESLFWCRSMLRSSGESGLPAPTCVRLRGGHRCGGPCMPVARPSDAQSAPYSPSFRYKVLRLTPKRWAASDLLPPAAWSTRRM